MPNEFCRFLSNGYRLKKVGNDITYAPCCWYNKEISIYASDFQSQKKKISNVNHWTPECGACKQIEDSNVYGNRSPRARSFYEVADESAPADVPVWLEISIDDTCNAACVICGPWHSTTWQKQQVKFNVIESVPSTRGALDFLADLTSVFSFEHVRSVSFLGGEPFLSPVPLLICRQLAAFHGSLKYISVHFQTNGSVLPEPELWEILQDCADLRLNFSIDGVNNRFEYLRYPLRWNRVEEVIDKFKSLSSPKVFYSVLATLNPINCLYFDEVEQWAKTIFEGVQLRSVKPNRASGRLDLANTPPRLRNMVYQRYGKDHAVTKMFSNLQYRQDPQFMEFVTWLDSARKMDWRSVFPEVAPMFRQL